MTAYRRLGSHVRSWIGRAVIQTAIVAASAAILSSPAVAQQAPVHLVVFNKPGPNFHKLSEMRELALAHRDIYLKLAHQREIIASGRMTGEPVLGLTVFRPGADEQSIRRLLADDPIAKAGVLEIEFRHWSIQMGALSSSSPGAK